MKGKGLAAAVMIACLLTGCVRYDGSRIGNESQLSMMSPASKDSSCWSLPLKTRYSIDSWLSFPMRLPS